MDKHIDGLSLCIKILFRIWTQDKVKFYLWNFLTLDFHSGQILRLLVLLSSIELFKLSF